VVSNVPVCSGIQKGSHRLPAALASGNKQRRFIIGVLGIAVGVACQQRRQRLYVVYRRSPVYSGPTYTAVSQ